MNKGDFIKAIDAVKTEGVLSSQIDASLSGFKELAMSFDLEFVSSTKTFVTLSLFTRTLTRTFLTRTWEESETVLFSCAEQPCTRCAALVCTPVRCKKQSAPNNIQLQSILLSVSWSFSNSVNFQHWQRKWLRSASAQKREVLHLIRKFPISQYKAISGWTTFLLLLL